MFIYINESYWRLNQTPTKPRSTFFRRKISVDRWQLHIATMNHLQINDAMFDYLIARSGIVGRQILKLCRFIHREDHDKFDRATGLEEFWLRQLP